MGAGKVIVVEPAAHRRQVALDVTASAAIIDGRRPDQRGSRLTGGPGADVVFECAGITATIFPRLFCPAWGLHRSGGLARPPVPIAVGGHW